MFIYCLVVYPWQTIICALIILVAYLIISQTSSKTAEIKGREAKRKAVLREARIYLSPYKDIWRNLKLSNKHCSLRLGTDGLSITARDANNPKRCFKVEHSSVHSNIDLWDMFCVSFDHNTTFNGLVELCNKFNVIINIKDDDSPNSGALYNHTQLYDTLDVPQENIKVKEKLDVNNASEIELTALPGISIVMSKKLINKREEIGGFKSVKDVFTFLKLKPHMQNQLENLICVKKMNGSLKIERFDERRVDL